MVMEFRFRCQLGWFSFFLLINNIIIIQLISIIIICRESTVLPDSLHSRPRPGTYFNQKKPWNCCLLNLDIDTHDFNLFWVVEPTQELSTWKGAFTWVVSCKTRLERPNVDQHSSLLWTFINYGHKNWALVGHFSHLSVLTVFHYMSMNQCLQ